jgi:hypothetical protein
MISQNNCGPAYSILPAGRGNYWGPISDTLGRRGQGRVCLLRENTELNRLTGHVRIE